jgi:hypothetical protein
MNDCVLIQTDLNALQNWCRKWKLEFNVTKCKVLSVTRSRKPMIFNYHINGEPIERVYEFKDLGILIRSDLSWNNHIKSIISKAKRMMGLIKRTVGYRAPQNVKLQLYTSLVRSNLEYCTQAWNGLTKQNRVKIERIQRGATRYILNFPTICYTARLTKLNLLPLSFRRDILDLNFFYKCFIGITPLKVTDFITFTCNSNSNIHTRNSSDPNLIKQPYCKTTTFKNAFFNRISYSWNKLPLTIRSLDTINSFTFHVKQHFLTILPKFNPECCCCFYVKCDCLHARQAAGF